MWLFFPSSQSAQAVPDSTEVSSELCAAQVTSLAASCTASGKHSPPATWSKRWRAGGWIRRLSGLTAQQSPQECASTYGAWLDGILSGSSAESRVSHSAQPASAKGSTTIDGSGPTSSDSWPIAAWDGACWRTSPDLFGPGSPLSPETWPRSGGVSRGRLFERPPLVLPIVESGCSSSGWTTPSVGDSCSGQSEPSTARRVGGGDRSLRVDAAQWYPTPAASSYGTNSGGSVPGPLRPSLETWARNEWATPRASENENRMTKHQPSAGNGHGFALAAQACEWPTPRAAHGAGQSDDLRGGRSLDVLATTAEWSTPRATDGEKGGPGQTFGAGGVPLCAQAGQWPTPTSGDAGQHSTNYGGGNMTLTGTASQWPTATVGDSRSSGGRTESEHCNNGVTLSDHVRGKGRLNWRFVAWLMGWRWLIGETPRPWPPGPKDSEAWAEVLAVRPDLAPATAQAEPDRAAMLRLLGNGVVPEQAEAAVSGLLRRLAPVALRSAV